MGGSYVFANISNDHHRPLGHRDTKETGCYNAIGGSEENNEGSGGLQAVHDCGCMPRPLLSPRSSPEKSAVPCIVERECKTWNNAAFVCMERSGFHAGVFKSFWICPETPGARLLLPGHHGQKRGGGTPCMDPCKGTTAKSIFLPEIVQNEQELARTPPPKRSLQHCAKHCKFLKRDTTFSGT